MDQALWRLGHTPTDGINDGADYMEGFVMLHHDPSFPREDVLEIAGRLEASGILVPGFLPPPQGLLDLAGIWRDQVLGGRFVLLVDRNIVSRMARIARDGVPALPHKNDRSAIDLMAYAQAMDINIEPSVAFHELADKEENQGAHTELAWFRAADEGNALAWIDLAMGRVDKIAFDPPPEHGREDLAFPLRRWRRNYVMALEIAKLELQPMRPVDRIIKFFDWMYEDYQWGGPASLFATMYFGPKSQRRRLLKDLKSVHRERAIAGVRNAAWDITHLSDLSRRVNEGAPTDRFILASGDRALVALARLLAPGADPSEDRAHRVTQFSAWWPVKDAEIVADRMLEHLEKITAGRQPKLDQNPTDRFIAEGEGALRAWSPTAGSEQEAD